LSPALLYDLDCFFGCGGFGVIAHALLLASWERVGVFEGAGGTVHASCAVDKVHREV